MSCQFFDFPNYTELEINFPSNILNVFLPAHVTLNKHPKVFMQRNWFAKMIFGKKNSRN